MLGLVYALPTLLLVVLAIVSVLLGATWVRVLALIFRGSGSAAAMSGIVLLGGIAGLEMVLRFLERRHHPRWAAELGRVARSERASRLEIGSAAYGLARLAAIGLPIPPTLVLTAELGALLLSASAASREKGSLRRALPMAARRALVRFLRRAPGATVIVRPSFVVEDGSASHAGIFATARADADDLDAVLAAAVEVLASKDGEAAREYRKRRNVSAPLSHALVLQIELPGDAWGAASSRGLEGRGDRALVDFSRKRSPSRAVYFDYLDGEAQSLLPGGGAVETPGWLRQLAWAALVAEEALDGPVQLEYVVVEETLWIKDARRVPVPARRSFSCGWPSKIGTRRSPALIHDLRGGLAAERDALGIALARAGVDGGLAEDEVRYVEGVPYVDVVVARRAISRVARALLLGAGLRPLASLLGPVRSPRLPEIVVPRTLGKAGWQEIVAWRGQRYVRIVQRYYAVATRGALLRAAEPILVASGHPLLARLVAFRARGALAEVGRLETYLEATEARIGELAKGFLAQGAGGFDQLFAGDRHLHLSLAMVEQWFEGDAARASLEAKWRERKATLAQREDHPPVERVHQPPLAASQSVPVSIMPQLRGVGIVAGLAQGTAVLVSKRDARLPRGSVAVFADGAGEDARVVLEAEGVVFLGSGASSAAAAVAHELGIPAVACPEARPGSVPGGGRIALDAAAGIVRI